MAHSDKQQSGFSYDPDADNHKKTQALSRDIENLNTGIRVDFDQKLSEIADLLARFKALVTAPNNAAANDNSNTRHGDVAPASHAQVNNVSATVTPLFQQNQIHNTSHHGMQNEAFQSRQADAAPKLSSGLSPEPSPGPSQAPSPAKSTEPPLEKSVQSESGTEKPDGSTATQAETPVAPKVVQPRFAPEPARFETGLYKLNSQLYRFRLELDQEMEFREEPLHVHFQEESELSRMFQKLSDASGEKHTDG